MGRKKIQIRPIDNNRSRQITFNKRKTGLMKKAYELSTLCGCDVAIILFNGDKLIQYANDDFDTILLKYTEAGEPKESRTNFDFDRLRERLDEEDSDNEELKFNSPDAEASTSAPASSFPTTSDNLFDSELQSRRSLSTAHSQKRRFSQQFGLINQMPILIQKKHSLSTGPPPPQQPPFSSTMEFNSPFNSYNSPARQTSDPQSINSSIAPSQFSFPMVDTANTFPFSFGPSSALSPGNTTQWGLMPFSSPFGMMPLSPQLKAVPFSPQLGHLPFSQQMVTSPTNQFHRIPQTFKPLPISNLHAAIANPLTKPPVSSADTNHSSQAPHSAPTTNPERKNHGGSGFAR